MYARSTSGRMRGPLLFLCVSVFAAILMASSHREAPMIADDPVADNTDLYAFRSPTNSNKVVLVANWIPFEDPQGGPNYHHFSEDVRYEIHIDNNITTTGDDIIYRFRFTRMNEDPSTFFLIRLGKENLKTTYTMEKSMDGGKSFSTVISNGVVPPPNVGPRSISSPVGLNAPDYNTLMRNSIRTASSGERVFAGPIEDPFFTDIGGIFDLGDAPRTSGGRPRDGLACHNVHSITMEIDISALQKDKKPVSQAVNILDGNYIIGVWASASRQKMSVLNGDGTSTKSGDWVQVSRLGMPLTNEVIIPIGKKDLWNALSPYDPANAQFYDHFYNPELALYMDEAFFASAVPAFSPLRIQKRSLGKFGFGNTQDGLFPLKGNAALAGTALAENAFGSVLLPGPGKPRSVDLWPIFHTGVPNLRPYQLAIGKGVNPLAEGKPFINNFLPNGGDMLRLNMAVPATSRTSEHFSSLGLIQAIALGVTESRYNRTKRLQFIPNMDGFPNGRRLEDDVTRIELQAVSGLVLAAIGLYYDDYRLGSNDFITKRTEAVYNYSTGINKNDASFKADFPFVQRPNPGNGPEVCDCNDDNDQGKPTVSGLNRTAKALQNDLGLAAPGIVITTENPVVGTNTIRYRITSAAHVQLVVYDVTGNPLKVLVNAKQEAGTYSIPWNTASIAKGTYMITASKDGEVAQTVQVVKK